MPPCSHRMPLPSPRCARVGFAAGALLVSLALPACGGPQAKAAPEGRERRPAALYLLSTLHEAHLSSCRYSVSALRTLLGRLRPQRVLVEIPPSHFRTALASAEAFRKEGSPPKDPWLKHFPELFAAVLPLRHSLAYEVVPVSGWRPEVSQQRAAYYRKQPQGPQSDADYLAADRAFKAALQSHAPLAEHPGWVHGESYEALSGAREAALDDAAASALGIAAPRAINAAHWQHIHGALTQGTPAKTLVVYGALHAWYLRPRLARLKGYAFASAHTWLPERACDGVSAAPNVDEERDGGAQQGSGEGDP